MVIFKPARIACKIILSQVFQGQIILALNHFCSGTGWFYFEIILIPFSGRSWEAP